MLYCCCCCCHTYKEKKTPVGLSYHRWGEGGIVWVTLQLLTSRCKKTLRQQCMLLPHLAVKTKPIVKIDMGRLLRLEHRIHRRGESSGPNQLQGLERRGIKSSLECVQDSHKTAAQSQTAPVRVTRITNCTHPTTRKSLAVVQRVTNLQTNLRPKANSTD
jgi:hypothetical protein